MATPYLFLLIKKINIDFLKMLYFYFFNHPFKLFQLNTCLIIMTNISLPIDNIRWCVLQNK